MSDTYIKKNRRYMILTGIIGIIIVIADIISSASANNIPIVVEDGKGYMIRPKSGAPAGHITLSAEVAEKGINIKKDYNITLMPYEQQSETKKNNAPIKELTDEEEAEYQLRLISGSFNRDLSLKKVPIPNELKSGAQIKWQVNKSNHAPIIIMMTMIMIMIIYRSRFTAIKKQKKQERESVIRQLPEFVNRLVLLLNAGLVLNSALEKSIYDSINYGYDKNDYFCSNLAEILNTVRNTNGSINNEFRQFAKLSGIKELMRISGVINDNIHKGVSLTEKLETESEILWITRKKDLESTIKNSENYMLTPLIIFLISLIVITVAPALIEL